MAENRKANLSTAVFTCALFCLLAGLAPCDVTVAHAQLLVPGAQTDTPNPLTDTTVIRARHCSLNWKRALPKTWLLAAALRLPTGLPATASPWAMAQHRHRQSGHRQVGHLVTEGLSTNLDPHRCHDGSLRRYGLYLGPLRRTQQRCQWLPGR